MSGGCPSVAEVPLFAQLYHTDISNDYISFCILELSNDNVHSMITFLSSTRLFQIMLSEMK